MTLDLVDLAIPATEILRVEVGSTLLGTGEPGGEDRDETGIAVENREIMLGLSKWDTTVHRTAAEGERSGPGDLDLTIYGLRKFMRLATDGNPSILTALFAPDEKIVKRTHLGDELRNLRRYIASRRAIPRYRGYMRAQALRLVGERGAGRGQRTGARPELVERYGWDTKFGMHMIRLGLQGVELATTGELKLPMGGPDGDYCREVRAGKHSVEAVLQRAFELDAELASLETAAPALRPAPDFDWLEEWMATAYLRTWGVL